MVRLQAQVCLSLGGGFNLDLCSELLKCCFGSVPFMYNSEGKPGTSVSSYRKLEIAPSSLLLWDPLNNLTHKGSFSIASGQEGVSGVS